MYAAPTATRCKPLAASVVACFALAPVNVLAVPPAVTNCSDHDPGSLRAAIGDPGTGSNSTIDLGGLGCSLITLTTGAISVPQANLIIKGPVTRVTITAKNSPVRDRVFTHTGTGNFELNNLDVEYGRAYDGGSSGVNGGCVSSSGNVLVFSSGVYHCSANSLHGRVYGGGVYAAKAVWADHATVADNYTTSLTASTYGGGVYAKGQFIAKYSTISGNVAGSSPGSGGIGGGAAAAGGASIGYTTISGNVARSRAGGLSLRSEPAGTKSATISDSTVSGNRTSGVVGGVYSDVTISVRNSTIAFNTAATGSSGSAAGLAVAAQYGSITATLNSALLSNNIYGTTESDFSTRTAGAYTLTVSGADNLIRAYSGSAPATGLITGNAACARLGPLRDNGGPNWTHQLLSGSAAIDAGDNVATTLDYDQRGAPFARSAGAAPDIGAYEADPADIVFNDGFEGCP